MNQKKAKLLRRMAKNITGSNKIDSEYRYIDDSWQSRAFASMLGINDKLGYTVDPKCAKGEYKALKKESKNDAN